MKRLFVTLLLALVSATAMWAENYPVMIGGVRLTSDNYQNITAAGGFSAVKSGAGTVTYDPATATLTLANAEIEVTQAMGRVPGIASFVTSGSVTMVLAEGTTNTVTTANYDAVFFSPSLTIEGGGTGIFTSAGGDGLSFDPDSHSLSMTIRNCTLTTSGRHGIYGGNNYCPLVIDNATVRATGSQGSISRFSALTLEDALISLPLDAEWNATANAVCLSGSDTPITSEVLIEPDNALIVTVQDDMVLNFARYDVNNDGALTLTDLTMIANALVGRANYRATGLALSQTQARILPGSTAQLTATLTPNSPDELDYVALAWTTSNKYVARVTNTGLVTARHPGTCTITVQTLDGSNLSVSCEVRVIDPSTLNCVYLGLPSGTLWATCNLGASSPEDFGDYYPWGMTTPIVPNEKYTPTFEGYPEELAPEDDAAYVTLGSDWRMPSSEQFAELVDSTYTTQTYTTQNGVKGLLITSIVPEYEGNSIFLPAASYYVKYGWQYGEDKGYYWTRTRRPGWESIYATYFEETEPIDCEHGMGKEAALSIRPVRNQ